MGAGITSPIKDVGVRFNKHVDWHIKIITDLPKHYIWQQTYTYRTKQWRYTVYKNGEEALYDHANDPHEWTNLADHKDYQTIKAQLALSVKTLINKNYN